MIKRKYNKNISKSCAIASKDIHIGTFWTKKMNLQLASTKISLSIKIKKKKILNTFINFLSIAIEIFKFIPNLLL